jgi:hypothetical protein
MARMVITKREIKTFLTDASITASIYSKILFNPLYIDSRYFAISR